MKKPNFYIPGKPRFTYEYAKYKYNEILHNDLMNAEIKEIALTDIVRINQAFKRDLCTIKEYMQIISNIEKRSTEKLAFNKTLEIRRDNKIW